MTDQIAEEKQHVLVIDDSKVVRWQASKLLEQEYQVHLAEDGKQAWELLQQDQRISLAFCDLQMPEMNGYQLLEQIRSSSNLRLINLPVVIITGDADDQEAKSRCLQAGATDFIPKPFDEVILKGRAAAYTGYQRRIAALESSVELDSLTGLASVQYFRRFGEQGVPLAQRHNTPMTIVLAELDQQDELIDQLGKKLFAQVLVRVGNQVSTHLRGEDLIARVGLARYGVILPMTNRIGARRAVERIQQSVHALRLKVADQVLSLTLSIGVTTLQQDHHHGFMVLVKQAESALAKVRANGGNGIALFAPATAGQEAAVPPLTATQAATAPAPVVAAADQNDVAVSAAAAPAGRGVAPTEQELAPLRELDLLAGQISGEGVSSAVLRRLMRRLLPLIEYADKRLELGLADLLPQLRQRLAGD